MIKPKPPTDKQQAAREQARRELLWDMAKRGNPKAKEALRRDGKPQVRR